MFHPAREGLLAWENGQHLCHKEPTQTRKRHAPDSILRLTDRKSFPWHTAQQTEQQYRDDLQTKLRDELTSSTRREISICPSSPVIASQYDQRGDRGMNLGVSCFSFAAASGCRSARGGVGACSGLSAVPVARRRRQIAFSSSRKNWLVLFHPPADFADGFSRFSICFPDHSRIFAWF